MCVHLDGRYAENKFQVWDTLLGYTPCYSMSQMSRLACRVAANAVCSKSITHEGPFDTLWTNTQTKSIPIQPPFCALMLYPTKEKQCFPSTAKSKNDLYTKVQNTEQDKSHNGNILVLCMMNKSWLSVPNLLTSAVPLLKAQMFLYLCFLNSDCEWFWTKSQWLGKTRIWKSRISFLRLVCFLLYLDTLTCSVTVNQLISPQKINIILENGSPQGFGL